MLINCVAYQDGPQARRHPGRGHRRLICASPDCFVWVALRDATRRRAARRCSTSSTCTNWRSRTRATATSGRRSRSTATRCSSVMQLLELRQRRAAASARWRSSSARTSCSRCATAASRASSACASAASASPSCCATAPASCFYALMDAVVDRYFPLLDALETELETIEAQIFERGAARWNIERLYALKRRATVLRHAVAPLLEVAGKLHGGRVPAVCAHSAGVLPRRARPPGAHQRLDRRDPRHHRHRDPGQPVDGDHRGVRDHQAAGGLGRRSSRCRPRWPASGA